MNVEFVVHQRGLNFPVRSYGPKSLFSYLKQQKFFRKIYYGEGGKKQMDVLRPHFDLVASFAYWPSAETPLYWEYTEVRHENKIRTNEVQY